MSYQRFSIALFVAAFVCFSVGTQNFLWGGELLPQVGEAKVTVTPPQGELKLDWISREFPRISGFQLAIHYSSQGEKGRLGQGWITTLESRIESDPSGTITLHRAGHRPVEFAPSSQGEFRSTMGNLQVIHRRSWGYSFRRRGWGEYSFSRQGALQMWRNEEGHWCRFHYQQGRLVKVENLHGETIDLFYENRRLTRIRDDKKREIHFHYNHSGNLLRWTNGRGESVTFGYTRRGEIEIVNEGQLMVRYNRWGQVAFVGGSSQAPVLYKYRYSNQKPVYVVEITDRPGKTIRLEYAVHGRSLRVIPPTGRSQILYFNRRGQIKGHLSSTFERTQFAYDRRHRLVRWSKGPQKSGQISYDGQGQIDEVRFIDGRRQRIRWDHQGRVDRISSTSGSRRTFSYPSSRDMVIDDEEKGKTRLQWDDRGRLVRVEENGESRAISYDKKGRVTKVKAARTWIFGHRQKGRETTVECGALRGKVKRDGLGRWREITDFTGTTWTISRDGQGRVNQVLIDGRSFVLCRRDQYNRLTSITDGTGRRHRFSYSDQKNSKTWADPLGHQQVETFDSRGQLVELHRANRRKVQYQYDKKGQVKSVQSGKDREEFRYDNQGRLVEMKNRDSWFQYRYDNRDQVIAVKDLKLGATVNYRFDNQGRRISMTTPQGTTRYRYNSRHQLTSLTDYRNQTTRYRYNRQGRLVKVTHPNRMSTHYRYNSHRQLASMTVLTPGGQVALSRKYRYRGFSLATVENEKGQITRYRYDKLGRLVKVKQGENIWKYTYDLAGNRISSEVSGKVISGKFDGAGRLVSHGRVRFLYDESGNTVARIAREGRTNYVYNGHNRLVRVEKPTGEWIEFGYGPNGARIWKKVNGEITRYLYDLVDVIAEYRNGKVVRSYVHGPGWDDPLAVDGENGARVYTHTAPYSGSVLALSGSSGRMVGGYRYSPFGRIISQWGQSQVNPYRFAGGRYDSETGLTYFRARYYSAETGRFTQRDPIGFAGGLNLYVYCENSPVTRRDPWGTKSQEGGLSAHWNRFKSTVASKLKSARHYTRKKIIQAKRATEVGFNTVVRTSRDIKHAMGMGSEREVQAARRKMLGQLKQFGNGMVDGLKETYQGMKHLVQNPDLVVAMGKAIVTDPVGTFRKLKEVIGNEVDEFVQAYRKNPEKFAYLVGKLTSDVIASAAGGQLLKGAGKLAQALKKTKWAQSLKYSRVGKGVRRPGHLVKKGYHKSKRWIRNNPDKIPGYLKTKAWSAKVVELVTALRAIPGVKMTSKLIEKLSKLKGPALSRALKLLRKQAAKQAKKQAKKGAKDAVKKTAQNEAQKEGEKQRRPTKGARQALNDLMKK